MNEAIFALIGFLLGAATVLVVVRLRRRQEADLARALLEEAQETRADELTSIIEQLKVSFSALSREALSANTDDFLKLAKDRLEQQTAMGKEQLEGKRKLIETRLAETNKKLTELGAAMQDIEKQRRESQGVLRGTLDRATQVTNRLHETTSQLREALANPQRRGQWGERMAEDVLQLAGFIEGINYTKQESIAGGGRPDFTFLLPDNRRVNMDVKFPLANYLKVLDAPDDDAREGFTKQFIRDVRSRIKEVTTREYIDPGAGTVDYVLVFIPNEQVYGFIHEHDASLLDDALRSKVVLCSPLTLYAVLAVIRQSVENFRLEQASAKILDLLVSFKKQWKMFVDCMDTIGKRLDDASKAFDTLQGTRTRMLERQLDKIENLRADSDLRLSDESGD